MDYRREIKKAGHIKDRLQRALHVVGLWTKLLEPLNIRPIIVGGTAVEFYTFGAYATYDIDLVCAARDKALSQLEFLGFERTDSLRHWYHEDLALVIEIPDDELVGSHEKIVEVSVGPYQAHMIGIEDLILDRLRAYVHWNSPQDGEWARRLLLLHSDTVDRQYLETVAIEENLSEALKKLASQTPL